MACEEFAVCRRCNRIACDHAGPEPPSIEGVCIGYIGWPDCHSCGRISWDHDIKAPHGIAEVCGGYDPGEEFQGGGGGFGGGGASGSW